MSQCLLRLRRRSLITHSYLLIYLAFSKRLLLDHILNRSFMVFGFYASKWDCVRNFFSQYWNAMQVSIKWWTRVLRGAVDMLHNHWKYKINTVFVLQKRKKVSPVMKHSGASIHSGKRAFSTELSYYAYSKISEYRNEITLFGAVANCWAQRCNTIAGCNVCVLFQLSTRQNPLDIQI